MKMSRINIIKVVILCVIGGGGDCCRPALFGNFYPSYEN